MTSDLKDKIEQEAAKSASIFKKNEHYANGREDGFVRGAHWYYENISPSQPKEQADDLTRDEFAIGFANWLSHNYSQGAFAHLWNDADGGEFDTTIILEEFKGNTKEFMKSEAHHKEQPLTPDMRNYEIYSENFSKVITAETLLLAVTQFWTENPKENIIFAEDVKKRALDNALTPAPESQIESDAKGYHDVAEFYKDEEDVDVEKLAEEFIYSMGLQYQQYKGNIKNAFIAGYKASQNPLPVDWLKLLERASGFLMIYHQKDWRMELPEFPGDVKKLIDEILALKTNSHGGYSFKDLLNVVSFIQREIREDERGIWKYTTGKTPTNTEIVNDSLKQTQS